MAAIDWNGPSFCNEPPCRDATVKQLDLSWWQWLAENRLLDATPESLLATLTAHGFDRQTGERALADLEAHPFFNAARNHQKLQRKLESVVANLLQLQTAAPGWDTIERRECPSPEEFEARYLRGCRPVILTDIGPAWPAMRGWQLERLKARFADQQVQVQAGRDSDPDFELNKVGLVSTMRFGDFIDRIQAEGGGNDCYLTAFNELSKRPEFAAMVAEIGELPPYVDRARLLSGLHIWIGGRTTTPLHHDTVMLFHTQVVGRKRWRMISPLDTPRVYNYVGVFSKVDLDRLDLGTHPKMRDVRIIDLTLEPGETLFLPLGWWHQVNALAPSVSVSWTNLVAPNSWTYESPDMRHW